MWYWYWYGGTAPGSSSIFWLTSHSTGMPGGSNTLKYSVTKLNQWEGLTSRTTSTFPAPAHVCIPMVAMCLVGCNNITQDLLPLCISRSSYLILHNLTLATGEVGSVYRVTAPWSSTHSTDMVQACQLMTGLVATSHKSPIHYHNLTKGEHDTWQQYAMQCPY